MSFEELKTRFKKRLKIRRAEAQEARRRKDLLVESVRTHLLPVLLQRGFVAVPLEAIGSVGRKSVSTSPFGRLWRRRPDGGIDQVEIQFSTYERAAFRIKACAVPKEGMMTDTGHKTSEECVALGVHDLETHARPWLRPILRAIGLEPLGEWFSVWHWPLRPPTRADYDKLALRAVAILPELELALHERNLGPHMRRLEFKPLPPEVLERMRRLKEEHRL